MATTAQGDLQQLRATAQTLRDRIQALIDREEIEELKAKYFRIVDTQDCISAARYLAAAGEVDGRQLCIRGGSAGGYTTLCALVFHDDFAAGASYFGVADLMALTIDTHKFESRYLDSMIGPLPAAKDLYYERSGAGPQLIEIADEIRIGPSIRDDVRDAGHRHESRDGGSDRSAG